MLFSGTFMEGSKWKKGETRASSFVFIGKNLDIEFLKIGFEACMVSDTPPRFAVGDAVMANCGAWKKGKVMKLWDDGNVYRIRLDDGTQVWAPVDVDGYVRAA